MGGTLKNERAPLPDDRECDYGPYYLCSSSLQSLHVMPSPSRNFILVRKLRIRQGTRRYRRNYENKYVDVSRDYGNYFNAIVLEKVNTEPRREERHPVEEEFYPALIGFLLQEGTGPNECLFISKNLWNGLVYLVLLVYPNFHITLMQMYGGFLWTLGSTN